MNSSTVPTEPDDNRGPTLVTIYVIQCSIALVFLALRLWARFSIHTLGWDDFFMSITWVAFAIATVFAAIVAAGGGYRHPYYLEPEQLKYVTRLNWISQPWGIIAQGTGKIAICFLFFRVFGTISTWRRYLIWFLMILTIIDCTLSIVFAYVQCDDPKALWDPEVRSRTHCWDPDLLDATMITVQALNCSFDFILAIIPVTFIWKLRFPLLKRIALILSLSGGFFSGICAAFKVKSLTILSHRSDFPRITYGLYIWASSEICVIILCGCIPTLMPLWDRFEKNFRSFMARSQPSSSQAPRERRRKPTCMRRGCSIELSGSHGRSDTVVSALGAKAFSDDSYETRSTYSQNTKPIIPRQDERVSIQVTKSFQVDYSNPQEA
ncbi:hypothetical protein F4818DRAFT_183923 [Hypoxylon cercidicola]|nr:hypothetical protein F4818DRAFT_183923 [Hypoxylon cercidicola]